MGEKRHNRYFPLRFWVNTRTPENNPLKYLQSKNECKVVQIFAKAIFFRESSSLFVYDKVPAIFPLESYNIYRREGSGTVTQYGELSECDQNGR
jgi:hypothetical protein